MQTRPLRLLIQVGTLLHGAGMSKFARGVVPGGQRPSFWRVAGA